MLSRKIFLTVPAGDGPGGQPATEDPEEGRAAAKQDQLNEQPQPGTLRGGAAAAPADQGLKFPPNNQSRK